MTSLLELLQYGFVFRGLLAGLMIAVIAPTIGIFLVLRRYSLIADTLSHISLAGVALGLIIGIHPLIAAVIAAVVGAVGLEQTRSSRKVSSESAMALFLSGSLALAVVLITLTNKVSTSLFNYLFGSISTVTSSDLWIILGVGLIVLLVVALLFKRFVYVAFDEEAAQVSGLPVKFLNTLFMVLAAITIAISIPIIGILLISALVVIPVLTALQFHRSTMQTLLLAQLCSILAVAGGFFLSLYYNLAPGGTIVLTTIFLFMVAALMNYRGNRLDKRVMPD
jgi:zinc transport system permease protein